MDRALNRPTIPARDRGTPPRAAMQAANRVVGLLLRSPFHRLLGAKLLLLTYTGHKSGRRYSIPLGYHRDGDTVAIFAGNPWWTNFRESAPVTLYLAGRSVPGTARVVTNRDEARGWLLAFLRAAPDYAKFYDVALGPDGRPELDSVWRAAESKVVVRIDLT